MTDNLVKLQDIGICSYYNCYNDAEISFTISLKGFIWNVKTCHKHRWYFKMKFGVREYNGGKRSLK